MTQARPFSKLKKQLESLFVPELKMEINCVAYPIKSQYGNSSIPRFYVRLNKKIIWDFPKDFPIKKLSYHIWKDRTIISELLREYLDTPINELPQKKFKTEQISEIHQYAGQDYQDTYDFNLSLTDLLKAADRRIGKEKLMKWSAKIKNENVKLILEQRFNVQ